MTTMKPRRLIHAACAATLLLAPAAHGAGFQLAERSASGLGRAYSGEAAIADDASVIASNPAAMILLGGDWAYSTGVTAILPGLEVTGSYAPPGAPAGFTVPAIADDVASDVYVPYLYLAKKLGESVAVGFGSYTTYGLKTNYPLGFSARSVADMSELTSVNLNAAIAWRFCEAFTIGAGFDALYADGKLTSTLPNTLPTFDIAGDDWGYGYNLGVLYEATECTRFGLHYRSRFDLTLEGRNVSVLPGYTSAGTLDVNLPDTVEFSVYHQFDDRWAIHGDVLWTHWSLFDQLQPLLASGAPVPPTPENWDDTFRFAVGATWQASECLTLRAGIAYDQSPVDDAFRTLRIPDNDRYWLSVGLSWQVREWVRIDCGYTHIFSDSMVIQDGSAATGVFTGTAKGGVDLVSIGVSGEF